MVFPKNFLNLRRYSLGWMARLTPRNLKPEDKVNLSINMTDACIRICVDAARDRAVKEDEMIEWLRERIMYLKRRHHEV